MKKFLAAALSGFFAVFLLVCPKTASCAVSEGISVCLEVVVPSLFAFSAVSVYLQKSGLFSVILKPFTFVLSRILRFDEEICGIFLLANIGGYPVGITLITALFKDGRITEKDASRLLCCCFGSGPSFVIGIVGVRVFGSAAFGAAIYAACFLSSVIIALFVRARGEIVLKPASQKLSLTSRTFVDSVNAAAKAMLSVSVMVAAFSVVAAAAREIGLNSIAENVFSSLNFGENSSRILPAILDVTRVRDVLPTQAAPALSAGLLSFGGICVFLQISALSSKIPLAQFLISRLPAAAVAALLAALFSLPLSPDIQALAAMPSVFPSNVGLSLCTLAMCAILLADNRSRN